MLVPTLVLVLGLLATPTASAAVACSYDAGTGVASITFADGEAITIVRAGDDILVNGSACTGATITTTETIHLAESIPDGDELASLTLDLSGGPFAPGKTDEGDGSSEIEFTLGDEVLAWTLGQLIVDGSSMDETFLVGGPPPGDGYNPIELNGEESTLDWDVTGGPNMDEPIVLNGDGGNDELRGQGADILGGSWMALEVDGGSGDDLLVGSDFDDQIEGGPGTDTIAAKYRSWIDLEAGTAISYHGTDTLFGLENIIGSEDRDFLTGDDGPNRIDGAGGNWDVLAGGGGDDQIIGGEGDIDTVDFSAASNAVEVDVVQGTATGEGNDTIEGIEWVRGSPFDDHVISAPWVYWVHAGDGDDVVHPVAPNYVYGEGGADTLDLSAATGPVSAMLGIGDLTIDGHGAGAEGFENAIGSPFADVMFGTIGANRIVGGRGSDVVAGEEGADVLFGRRGHDSISGVDGRDGLYGGRGNDWLDGGHGVDTCFGGPGKDFVDLCEVLKPPAE